MLVADDCNLSGLVSCEWVSGKSVFARCQRERELSSCRRVVSSHGTNQ